MTSYDSLGGAHKTTITFTKTGPNAWSAAFAAGDTTATVAGGPVAITFDGNTGKVTTPTANQTLTVTPTGTGGAAAYPVQLDFTKLTQLVSPNDVTTTVDGAAAGGLVSFSVGKDGQVTGIYSNGLTKTLAQLAVATFQNPAGLQKAGGNNYRVSANSGAALIGTAGLGGRGEISSGFLEMSNVDLAQQFTNMIIANRGFQANSRVISTSDQMLQDLVNLNR
jgi:flagellar hook protein FlgE